MVYIYRKDLGNRSYYYLRISARKGSKVLSKDIAYLGSSIAEARKSLDKLPAHKGDLRKAYKTIKRFLDSNHYAEQARALKLRKDEFLNDWLQDVEACRLHYTKEFSRLDGLTRKDAFKHFVIEFAFNTTSIEGNTITLKQARDLLEEGLTPKNKTLREVYDIRNTEKEFFRLLECDEEISHDFVVELHAGLMENIDPRIGYRTSDVHVLRANFESTPAPYVKTDMALLLKWYEKNRGKMHPLVLAAIFHHKLEKIHPFMDGNGRTGRMLLNYILLRNGYPPIVVHKKARASYLAALRDADKSGLNDADAKEYAKLAQFMADEMKDSYWGIFL
jgi:Fic family protein